MGIWPKPSKLWRVLYLWAALFAVPPAASPATLSVHDLIGQIRAHVLEQVRIGGNYMCIQTADRHYFRPDESARSGCDHPLKHPGKMTEVMTDRLRLDVAVSDNREIYSWYGQQHFNDGSIDQLITNGPITSGGFGGFLRNIFLAAGIEFIYTGHSVVNGVPLDSFDYNVPLARSTYAIAAPQGSIIVPFNGSFTADSNTFELTSLTVEVPKVSPGSNVCYARSSIVYHMAHISGNDVLIPSHFDFKLEGIDHTVTDSQFDYRSCHAFTGESTISFKLDNTGASAVNSLQPIAKGPIRQGINFFVQLRTPIDDRDSYTGDPVEGVLLHDMKLRHARDVIPKGSLVRGIITQLEFHRGENPYYLLDISFNQIVEGNITYTMRATHLSTPGDAVFSPQLGGRRGRGLVASQSSMAGPTPAPLQEMGSHFHLNSGYTSEWTTTRVKSEPAGE